MTEPRIPPTTDQDWDDETRALVEGLGRLNIFATLAHHPKLMKRWLVFGNHVLNKSTLPVRERELAILRVGWRCDSEYEFGQHTIIGQRAGITDDEVARLCTESLDGWSSADAAIVRAADELVADHTLSDATWAELGRDLEHPAGDGPGLRHRPVRAHVHGPQHLPRPAGRGRPGVPRMSAADAPIPTADGATERGTRVAGKVAVVVGAGQTAGDTIGNGRATRSCWPATAPASSPSTATSPPRRRRWRWSSPRAARPSRSGPTSPTRTTASPWPPPLATPTAASTSWSTTSASAPATAG